jgi:hypothetical protein
MPKMSLEYTKHIISQKANAQFNTDADGSRVQHSAQKQQLYTLAREDGEGFAMVPLTYWEIYVTSYFLYCIVNCYLLSKVLT